MKNIWGFVKRHKILLSGATLLMIVALLGIQVTPVPIPKNHAVSIGSGQKYEVTIADKVLAAGLSADYTCNGTNDNVVWQNAINSVPANGGIVNDLTGGLYVFSGTVNVPAKVTINGIGRASYFSNNGVTPIFTSTGNGTCYQNISTDNGDISTGATTGWLETNVAVGTTLYTERSPNSSIVDNTYTGNVTGNLTGNVSATTVGATTLNAPTGRTASYVIVASDAPASVKAQADYVMPLATTDLGAVFNAAVAAGKYSIALTQGDFDYSTSLALNVNGASLTGAGNTTILKPIANVDGIVISAADNNVSNLRIFGDKTNRASGNGITLLGGGARGVISNVTIDHIKDVGIYKADSNNETQISNVSVTYSGYGIEQVGSGGLTSVNTWCSYNDYDGYVLNGASWSMLTNVRACSNGGNGMTIKSNATQDVGFVSLLGGDFDANYTYGIELITGIHSIKNVLISGTQFADQSYGHNNSYDDIYYNPVGGGGWLTHIQILGNMFNAAAVNDVRYRVNLGSTTVSDVTITGNDFATGVSGVVNIGANVPNVQVGKNIGWLDNTASGYKIDNTGIAAMAMDGASGWVNVPHGLSGTPTNVELLPLSAAASTRSAFINQWGMSTFQIQVTSTAAASPIAVGYALAIDGGVSTDETTVANNGTANDMTLMPVSPVVNDAYDFVDNNATYPGGLPFCGITVNIGTSGVGTYTITWEYFASDGTWKALAGVTDNTVGFTAAPGSHNVIFTIPTDWVSSTAYSTIGYHVRARVSAFTSMSVQPKGTQAWLLDTLCWMWRASIGNGN